MTARWLRRARASTRASAIPSCCCRWSARCSTQAGAKLRSPRRHRLRRGSGLVHRPAHRLRRRAGPGARRGASGRRRADARSDGRGRARACTARLACLAALDARMREVYVAAYEYDGAALERMRRCLAVVAPDAAPLPPESAWFGAGNGFDAYPAIARAPRRPAVRLRRDARAQRGRDRRSRRYRALAAGEGVRRARRGAALRASSRRADESPNARRGWRCERDRSFATRDLRRGVRWRPMRESDVVIVAELEARAHMRAVDGGQLPRCARRGLRHDGRRDRTASIVAYGVLMLAPGEAQLLNLTVARSVAPARHRARAAASSARRCARRAARSNAFSKCASPICAALALYRGRRLRAGRAARRLLSVRAARATRAKTRW